LTYFQHFKVDISDIKLPEKFTFPFYYQPHPLAKIATKELQDYLENQTDFKHNFGLSDKKNDLPIGKMFGVLVVKNKANEIGYLAAFSGKLADNSFPDKFVPPVFNMRTDGSFFLEGEEQINQINNQLSSLENDKNYLATKKDFLKTSEEIEADLILVRKKQKRQKKDRKNRKTEGYSTLNKTDFTLLNKELIKESFNNQFFYKELVIYYENKIAKKKKELAFFEDKIEDLKQQLFI